MKYYARFKTYNPLKDEVEEALGSDRVFVLDARKSIHSMILDARERMKQLSKVQSYVGGVIIKAVLGNLN